MKLTIELIPKSSFFVNVRSTVEPLIWNKIRAKCYRRAKFRCEICGGQGPNHPVECHECFEYDEYWGVQRLTRLIALCPDCHRCKHFGLATLHGKADEAIKHLMKINNISEMDAHCYLKGVAAEWERRNKIEWVLDLSYLDTYLDD